MPPGAETGIVLNTSASVGGFAERIGTFSGTIFSTADVQATDDELTGRGVQFTAIPATQPWGMMQAIFVDPDNNQFVLIGPLPN